MIKIIQSVKKLLRRPYSLDFKCGKCKNILVLRSDVPLVKDETHCFNGESHSGMVVIETKVVKK